MKDKIYYWRSLRRKEFFGEGRFSVNKKAVAGNILTSLPMIASVIFLVILYLILVFFARTLIQPPAEKAVALKMPSENLLLKPAEFEFQDGSRKELLVYDFLKIYFNTHLSEKAFYEEKIAEALKPLEKEGSCYYLSFVGPNKGTRTNLNLGREIVFGSAPDEAEIFHFWLNEGLTEVRTYYGPCGVKNE